ncbi:MAG TPA: polysaccharide deacetylase family protein [Acidimicrobiia bacterium]
MEFVAESFQPVTASRVASWSVGETDLPARAVWVTFDDGDPSVIERAQPILDRMGIEATLFVCPGLVDTTQPYWWQLVEKALALGIDAATLPLEALSIAKLKSVDDPTRRRLVDRIADLLEMRLGFPFKRRQLTSQEIDSWLASGHRVGNHTWDHPLLDTCSPQEQVDQIARADRWLRDYTAETLRLFAYPNGNWSPESEDALVSLDYQIGVAFDHRIASNRSRFRLSRLRATAGEDLRRFRSILSGAHPLIHRLRGLQ